MEGTFNELKQRPPLRFFCQLALPAVYDDELSYYEVVCKVVSELNGNVGLFNELVKQVNMNTEEIAALKELFEKFQESGFDEYYKDQVEQWINANLDFIFTHTVKQVFFGLTRDGHFCAYVPKSWNDIIFDTGMNYKEDTYGRLILRWDVDAVHTVDQTPETVLQKQHGSTHTVNRPF